MHCECQVDPPAGVAEDESPTAADRCHTGVGPVAWRMVHPLAQHGLHPHSRHRGATEIGFVAVQCAAGTESAELDTEASTSPKESLQEGAGGWTRKVASSGPIYGNQVGGPRACGAAAARYLMFSDPLHKISLSGCYQNLTRGSALTSLILSSFLRYPSLQPPALSFASVGGDDVFYVSSPPTNGTNADDAHISRSRLKSICAPGLSV